MDRTFVNVVPNGDSEVAAAPKPPAKKAAAKPAKKQETKVQKAKTEKKEVAPKKEAAPPKAVEEKKPAPTEKPKAPKAAKEKKTAAPKKGEKVTLPSGKKVKVDDLKAIEGIGPKIAGLLNDAGINTWAELAEAKVDRLNEILEEAGSRYRMHDPTTWPKQAKFAAEGQWEELENYQDQLKGGKE
ncbi:MAG: DUF4332 domain-containing protein [Saprospiraceae bacterium]|nr:DUF4332 domain-containing protein [Saprospiraceae bacterium]